MKNYIEYQKNFASWLSNLPEPKKNKLINLKYNKMKNFEELSTETKQDFINIIIEELEHNCLNEDTVNSRYGGLSELHNRCFNEDYFIIGYYQANKFIEENFNSTFEAIDIVKEYEEDNFGYFNTPIDSESIANMLAYIIGEELVFSIDEDFSIKNVINNLKNL